ncbi:proliferating cell nuclear antigen [Plasmopara halstedii]|uniref:DNA sliding clamp PCNA n=1 Tax=Plasmopara halstedii TaxID=4781 RepID=A0A0P1B6Q1_PLAHL|nr:proliferating cell nuclear antigen [Plasmopara halstedii]CEG49791.1 proliferating cell nuclear antigen [Plasmopara halstedii]|eukprot:XP_024586160.1 proliferating cell nuclear antigen [Plasmopara halstedii]
MFEARLPQGRIFKLIVEAMKDLISEGNIDCTKSGLALQSMDGSHVSLVSLLLRAEGFEHYRCDRNISLGVQTASLSKILKCSGNDDALSLSAEDNGDALNIMFEATSGDRVSDFSLKLMDIDSEHLGIPGTEYVATVRMPAGEFQRICRDLQTMGDTCTIAVGKEGVKFSVSGDLGAGNITLKNNTAAEKESDRVIITMEEPVELTFALRYLNMFAKATPLSETVTLSMSPGIPVVVEYAIGDMGYMRFYLAPKVEEDD